MYDATPPSFDFTDKLQTSLKGHAEYLHMDI